MKGKFKIHFPTLISIISQREKPKKNGKKRFFVLFTSTYTPKKTIFWPFFCPTCKRRFLFLLLMALFFSIHLIFVIPTSKLGLLLLKKPKEQLNCLLGTAFIIKSRIHAHSDEKIAFSINFEIAIFSSECACIFD